MTETLPATTEPKAELVAGGKIAPIIPRNVEEAFRVAQAIVKAGLAPESYKNDPQRILIGIMKAAEVGLPPITGLNNITIINGRPSIYGDGAVALVQASGKLEDKKEFFEGSEEDGDWTAVCQMWRKGQDTPYEGRFSMGQAKRAKLWGKIGPWMTYPQRMLMWRARAFAMRDGFADCLSGLSIAEEVQDIPAAPEKTDLAFLEAPDEPTATEAAAVSMQADLDACEDLGSLDEVWTAGQNHRAALPDDLQAQLEAAYAARRETLET